MGRFRNEAWGIDTEEKRRRRGICQIRTCVWAQNKLTPPQKNFEINQPYWQRAFTMKFTRTNSTEIAEFPRSHRSLHTLFLTASIWCKSGPRNGFVVVLVVVFVLWALSIHDKIEQIKQELTIIGENWQELAKIDNNWQKLTIIDEN